MKATVYKEYRTVANQHEGETVKELMLVTCDRKTGKFDQPVLAVWTMGRSRNASRVYCTVWAHDRARKVYVSGSGWAGGYGYCKYSAAFSEACKAARISFDEGIAGAGMTQVKVAMKAIARGYGFGRLPQTIVG